MKIIKIGTNEEIRPETLFILDDITNLYWSCDHILQDKLGGNPSHKYCNISLKDSMELAQKKGISINKATLILKAKWEKENPDLKIKEKQYVENWKNMHNLAYRKLFGISKRNGYYIKMRHDCFEIYKKQIHIANICI